VQSKKGSSGSRLRISFGSLSVCLSVCKPNRLENTLQNTAATVVFFTSPSTLPHSLHAHQNLPFHIFLLLSLNLRNVPWKSELDQTEENISLVPQPASPQRTPHRAVCPRRTQHQTLHYTTLHYTTLHYTTLHPPVSSVVSSVRIRDLIQRGYFKNNVTIPTYRLVYKTEHCQYSDYAMDWTNGF
jgi:hypothetical protein